MIGTADKPHKSKTELEIAYTASSYYLVAPEVLEVKMMHRHIDGGIITGPREPLSLTSN